MQKGRKGKRKKERLLQSGTLGRLQVVGIGFFLIAVTITIRLFSLMIINHDLYVQLAQGAHELYTRLTPKRGVVLVQDTRTEEEYPLALNRDVFLLYADTRRIETNDEAEQIAYFVAEMFGYEDAKRVELFHQLNKRTDPYEPIEQTITQEQVDILKEQEFPGIGFIRKPQRVYPEKTLAAQIVGFLGKTDDGEDIGRYGIEGYWQEELAGIEGYFEGLKSAKGKQIPLAGKSFEEAQDGSDIVLTVDRTIQYQACKMLQDALQEYEAQSASLVILDPQTGAVLAMCSVPDFDPNTYGKVDSIDVYNNTTIFTPYEPGSIFKPITMAAAVDQKLVAPGTPFYDKGSIDGGCTKPIRNADGKVYEQQNMNGVLENSINTGMVHIANLLGKKRLISYIEEFGFGTKTGIELDTEVTGTIDTLYVNSGDKIDCYGSTASFGQGITVTPLQMVAAFNSLANGGYLMRPYITEEIRHADGKIDRMKPIPVKQVISSRTAALVSGMLVNVVDSGQAGGAGVPGYYVAGKTGTAQIAGQGGYTEDTNHSFIGFAPIDDPKFTMIVKFEKPQRRFSASTAAPTFGKIAKFVLQYYGVPPSRN